jgi:hypothetical protein
MRSFVLKALFATYLLTSSLTPLFAELPGSEDPVALWVDAVNARVDQVIAAPAHEAAGVVKVIFQRGPRGRPVDVAIHAANRDLQRAAEETIVRMGALPPLPSGYGPEQRISMELLFSNDGLKAYAQERAAMLASAAQANHLLAAPQTVTLVARADPQSRR